MHKIKTSKTFTLPLYNGGVNEMNIKFAKESLIMESFRTLLDTIDTKKHYPIDDVLTIDLSLDAVLLTTAEYENLIKQINV